jgi:long-chain acyl-CoA synthetase
MDRAAAAMVAWFFMARPNPIAVFRLLRRAGVPPWRIGKSLVESLLWREARGVHALFDLHARARPGRTAVVQGERRVSFEDLARRVRRLAGALGARGLGPGARAVVCLPNSPEFLVVTGAIRTLGAQTVPASPHLKRDEIEHVLADSGARAFFFAASMAEEALAAAGAAAPRGALDPRLVVEVAAPSLAGENGRGARGPTLEDLLVGPDLDLPPDDLSGEDRPAILYTSGTTGVPKGARPSLSDSMALIETFARLFRLGAEETILLPAPLYHAAPAMIGQIAMLLGSTLVLPPKFDAEEALGLIEREGVTFAYFVPYMLEAILRLPHEKRRGRRLGSLRGIVTAAAPIRPETRIAACDFFGDILCEFYGSTETGIVTFLAPEEQRQKPESVGRAVEGVELRILDAQGRELPRGETGEVSVRSAWIRTEYLGRPEETAAAHRGAFFATGDLGFIDAEGYLHISGRIKDMVNSAGVKIFPAEIERAIAQHPAVADVAVFPVKDERWGEAVWAAVVPARGAKIDEADLIAWLKAKLAGFKVPKRVVLEKELPRNSAGKILKRVLREKYERIRS